MKRKGTTVLEQPSIIANNWIYAIAGCYSNEMGSVALMPAWSSNIAIWRITCTRNALFSHLCGAGYSLKSVAPLKCLFLRDWRSDQRLHDSTSPLYIQRHLARVKPLSLANTIPVRASYGADVLWIEWKMRIGEMERHPRRKLSILWLSFHTTLHLALNHLYLQMYYLEYQRVQRMYTCLKVCLIQQPRLPSCGRRARILQWMSCLLAIAWVKIPENNHLR